MVHVEVQHVVEEVDKLVLLELAQHLLAEQHGLLHQSDVTTGSRDHLSANHS